MKVRPCVEQPLVLELRLSYDSIGWFLSITVGRELSAEGIMNEVNSSLSTPFKFIRSPTVPYPEFLSLLLFFSYIFRDHIHTACSLNRHSIRIYLPTNLNQVVQTSTIFIGRFSLLTPL